jgi:hypothetical protein
MRSDLLTIASAAALALACGDGGTPPKVDDEGRRLAVQFEGLADSVEAGGYSPAAEALRHAAEIVRLTGHASPVTLTIDGAARNFLAVAEQIDFPNLVCNWPVDSGVVGPPDSVVTQPPDSTGAVPPDVGSTPGDTLGGFGPPECTVEGTYSMRTLIAWEPQRMAEVARIVAHIGNNQAATGVPDVMTGLPTTTPPDSGSGSGGEPGGYPGFMGEYLVRDVGSWWAVGGNQSNDLIGVAGSCTDDRATFDWAEFSCEAARFRFELEMEVEPLRYEPLTGVADPTDGPEGRHTLSLGPSSVDGVRLVWESWTPPPEPGPGPDPIPVDSGVVRSSF